MTNNINTKKPFKYSHLERRIDANYVVSTEENYTNHAYDEIPKQIYYILLKHIPIEIIGIIWNIKVIREDADFCEYIKILHRPTTPALGMFLRSGRKLYMNDTHIGVFCNSITTYVFDKKIKNTIKIDMLHSTFLMWFEYLSINQRYMDSCKNLLEVMVSKIKEFTIQATVRSFDIKNDIWDNVTQRDKIIRKLDDCLYYIDNFKCITSLHPCGLCKSFDDYVNVDKYSKKKSFLEYFPQFDNCNYYRQDNYNTQADNWGNEEYPDGYG